MVSLIDLENAKKEADELMMNKIIKYENEIKKLKDRVNNAETETALIKATGMNSPEMISAKKDIQQLKKELCEVRQDNRKLSKQIEDGINRMRKAGLL
jgi:predicted  nucleic acid-binding Zn-ribbon protein